MSRCTFKAVCTAIALLLFACCPAFAQSFAIDWFNVGGGGGFSAGDRYSVVGSVGQADAGAAAGTNNSLVGGFWAVTSATGPGELTLTLSLTPTNSVLISWPAAVPASYLEETTSLDPSAWTTVTNAPLNSAGTNYVALPLRPGARFFRLHEF